MQPPIAAPPESIRSAFGATEKPMRLSGGFDGAWRCGELVLKRSRSSIEALECEERVLASVRDRGFRLQRLRRTRDGSLLVDGWIARDFLEGSHEPERWRQILEVGDALHAAVAGIERVHCAPMVVARSDPWAVADRIAWDEEPMPAGPAYEAEPLPRLAAARRPVASAPQLVHGDLSGNILFADGLAPAVIDFSPYFRPPQWATGVVVADCVVWFGASLDLVESVAERPEIGQCLIRAILFRHVTGLLLDRGAPPGQAAERYAALVDAALRLAKAP